MEVTEEVSLLPVMWTFYWLTKILTVRVIQKTIHFWKKSSKSWKKLVSLQILWFMVILNSWVCVNSKLISGDWTSGYYQKISIFVESFTQPEVTCSTRIWDPMPWIKVIYIKVGHYITIITSSKMGFLRWAWQGIKVWTTKSCLP